MGPGPVNVHQASCVAIGGRAVLIEGPPGSGKTSLALALIDRGAVLVGDDGVLIEPRDGWLEAAPHPRTRGLVEVRNLGIIRFDPVDRAPLGLVIRLDKDAPRHVDAPESVELLGVSLPMIRLWPDPAILPIKAELALTRYGRPLD